MKIERVTRKLRAAYEIMAALHRLGAKDVNAFARGAWKDYEHPVVMLDEPAPVAEIKYKRAQLIVDGRTRWLTPRDSAEIVVTGEIN